MTDWTAGYVADIGYTFGYYQELNPLRVKLAFLNAGLASPEIGTACELGFGQGVSTNLHAAASLTQWHGTDFNPSQAGFAQELATVSGAGAKLYDEAFADFANRADLPEFDYIGLHGIWSWISGENRAVIVDFLRRKLKVGGVLYISYNTQPGWAATVPLRDLLTEHGEVMGVPGHGIVRRIDAALDFADKLFATNPSFAKANPQVVERLKAIRGQNRNYLAHEYFNHDWLPMPFSRMAEWLSPAKLNFACSANYLDYVDPANLLPEQLAFLKEIPDTMFRETVRDFMVNQQFRKDYWVRGARRLSVLEQVEGLRRQRVMLLKPRAEVSLKVKGALGEATLHEAIHAPILDVLADNQPKTLGQIELAVKDKAISFAHVKEATLMLIGSEVLTAVQDEALIAKTRKQTDKLNTYLCNKARGSNDINSLVSPLTGGGVTVGRFEQLFLLAIGQKKNHPADLASFAWQILAAQGQNIIKEGKTLEGVEQNMAELTAQALAFSEKHLPILKILAIT